MVMCKEPAMRAPRSGCCDANSFRIAIRPGISVSAILISLRPQSASARSLTTKSLGCLIAAFIDRYSLKFSAGGSCGPHGFEFGCERACLVGALPGELRFLAAEVAVRGGLLIDGPREIQHLAEAKGCEIEMRAHQLRQTRVGQFTRAEGLDHDGGGFSHPNRI